MDDIPNISTIRLPPKNRKIGHQKGAGKTVFGRPKAKLQSAIRKTKGKSLFEKLSSKEKQDKILKWIKKDKNFDHLNNKFEIDNLNLSSEIVQRLANKNVFSLKLKKRVCSVDSYDKVETMVNNFIEIDKWICQIYD